MTDRQDNRDLPAWLWLGVPAASVLIMWLLPLTGGPSDKDGLSLWKLMAAKEGGWENLTVAFAVAAAVLAVLTVVRYRRAMPRAMTPLLVIFAIGAVFYAGEEASWGQHWLKFKTPEEIAKVNKQNEFNFHNLQGAGHTLTNKLLRHTANIGSIVAGVALPLLLLRWRRRPSSGRSLWNWLLPTHVIVPAAAIYAFGSIPKQIIHWLWPDLGKIPYHAMSFWQWWIAGGFVTPEEEFREYGLGLAILFYALSLFVRARSSYPSREGREACQAIQP